MANNHIHPHGNATREISCMNLMVLRLEARMEGRERERESWKKFEKEWVWVESYQLSEKSRLIAFKT